MIAPRPLRTVLAALALLAPPATALSAQTTLRDLVAIARSSAYGNRMARAAADAAHARTLTPTAGIAPAARLDIAAVRTTDPIGAFGTTLRQRGVTPAAFDPNALNFPAPVSNYSAGIVVEQPLFNADAWAGRGAARAAAAAATHQSRWTEQQTTGDVIRAWYGAVLAREKVATLAVARTTVLAHLEQARAMLASGLATKADLLLAQVRLGEVSAQLAQAESDAAVALEQLDLLAGRDIGAPALPNGLPSRDTLRHVLSSLPAQAATRADLQSADAQTRAAERDLMRTRAALLPRVNGFARWDWNSALRPWAGQENWTAGVAVSVPLLNIASQLGETGQAAARRREAAAGREAAHARAALDRQHTAAGIALALRQLDLTEQTIAQAEEAHRLVSRRYEGGLSTIAELLSTQSTLTQSRLNDAAARWGAIDAAVRRLHALGADPEQLVPLDSNAAVAVTGSR